MLSSIIRFVPKFYVLKTNKKLVLTGLVAILGISAALFGGQILAVAPVVGSVENETMSVPAGGSIINDSSASGGQALKITANNQYAQGSVNLSGAAVNLVLTARGDYCVGAWPRVSLYVDGTNVWTDYITTSTWSNYSIPVSKGAGSHTVRAVMRNAKSDASCTRAAYLDIEVFYGEDTGPPPQVDYVSESLVSSPSNPETGQSMSFSAVVRNQSVNNASASSNTSLRIDVSNDGSYDVTLPNQTTTALAAGASETENWPDAWTAAAGTHKYEVCADATSVLDETDEGNNCSTSVFTVVDPPPPPPPDYISEGLSTSPVNPETGQTASFLGTVRNQGAGDGTAASETSVRLDIGDDGTYDVSFANQSTPALTAGGTQAANWADAWTTQVGTHRYEVCADATNTLTESDESNNCTTATFTVNDPPPPPPPDYVAEALANSPLNPTTGESVSFLSMVRNQSTGDSSVASEASLRLDVGDDGTYDVNFANLPTSALSAGSSQAANWTDAWVAETGTHRFEVCADNTVTATVDESDENNNCTTQTFTVTTPPPPEPTLDFSADPSTINSGESSTLNWSAANVDTCTASGAWSGDKGLSGSESTGALTETSTYTLTCDGPYGSVVKDAVVTVNQPPPPGGCTITDTSGCVPSTRINVNNDDWSCNQPLANYGSLPIKVVVSSTSVIVDSWGVDLRTGCNGDSDPNSIDLILDVQGDGLTYGPAEDAVKVRQQAGWVNGIQITGSANCGPRSNTDIHQDGIQAQGGRDIAFVDFYVGNYDTGISTCQGAGGAMFYSSAGGYYGENIDVIRGKYIACNKALTTGSPGNTGSVTDALFRSGRVDGTDPKCIGINGPATCGGTGTVTITNVTCQKWDPVQQTFVTLLWP